MTKTGCLAGLALLSVSSSALAVDSEHMANVVAVMSAEQVCGFTVNRTMLMISLSAIGLSPADVAPGGIHRAEFDRQVKRIQRLTATESQRPGYCRAIATGYSALFDATPSVRESSVSAQGVGPSENQNSGAGFGSATATAEPASAQIRAVVRDDVRLVQKLLNDLGLQAGPSDGLLGNQTRKAVTELQKSLTSFLATGTVDPLLRDALLARSARQARSTVTVVRETPAPRLVPPSSAPSQTNFGPPKLSAQTRILYRLQYLFEQGGLYSGPVDGLMNTEMERAILRYQVANRVSADGKPSPLLLQIAEGEFGE